MNTMSLEICPKTLQDKKRLRLHLHLCLEWARRVRLGFIKDFTFCGAKVGHCKTDGSDVTDAMMRKQCRKICSDSAHFYLQVAKKGMVASVTNFRAFCDFNVNPK